MSSLAAAVQLEAAGCMAGAAADGAAADGAAAGAWLHLIRRLQLTVQNLPDRIRGCVRGKWQMPAELAVQHNADVSSYVEQLLPICS
jgi:hypothetical protein